MVVDNGVVVGVVDVEGEDVGDGAEADAKPVPACQQHFGGTKGATRQPRCMNGS